MSVLKKPTAVQEGEAAQVVKNVHPPLHLVDDSTGEDKLPVIAQRMHEKYDNAYHRSTISPFSL
jgi:hypothetical protein